MSFGKRRGENKRAEGLGHATREFWGRRPWGGWGKDDKRITHRIERRQAKREVEQQMLAELEAEQAKVNPYMEEPGW